ncbi:hypothetical protein [Nitrosarchaeum sp.]|uniref:hypothetical protein n=1 Tax=Nitrosarchaeum sp. TaxID=2026886 RepID=UPI00247C9BD2|nr:hypothetical protein [Nitrosarchaeum sp.]MCV0412196.1 hypothetical protein [Nitrosarchaeum sp.]
MKKMAVSSVDVEQSLVKSQDIRKKKNIDGKKLKSEILDQGYKLLSAIRYGGTSPKVLTIDMGISKQNLTYWLKKLIAEGVLRQPSKGNYFLTESGKRIHDQYERYKNKQLIRIENMKVTFLVEEGGSLLEEQLISQKQKLRNNVKIYHAILNFRSTRLIVGKSDYKFEVTITDTLGIDLNEAYHRAMIEAYGVVMYLQRHFKVKLSDGYCTGKPEIAIPSPIASSLLSTTGASQIRFDNAIMNRSKGRDADWEVHTIQGAQRIVDMPNTLDRIEAYLVDLKESSTPNLGTIYKDLAGNLASIYTGERTNNGL